MRGVAGLKRTQYCAERSLASAIFSEDEVVPFQFYVADGVVFLETANIFYANNFLEHGDSLLLRADTKTQPKKSGKDLSTVGGEREF
jgi:hypothetical protein